MIDEELGAAGCGSSKRPASRKSRPILDPAHFGYCGWRNPLDRLDSAMSSLSVNIRESSIHVHHAVDHLTHINCPLASAALGRR